MSNTIKLKNTPFQSIGVNNNDRLIIGATDHDKLKNRDLSNQHPISAITGLQEELDSLSKGVVFTPSVSDEGVISWTNNGGLANPTAVNIKGVKGDKGDTGAKGDKGDKGEQGLSGVYVGTGDMPSGYNVQIDPNGTTEDYATRQYVDSAIGDINTALDNIITIQNSLLGGA